MDYGYEAPQTEKSHMWYFKIKLDRKAKFVEVSCDEEAIMELSLVIGGGIFGGFNSLEEAQKAGEYIAYLDERALAGDTMQDLLWAFAPELSPPIPRRIA